MRNIYLCESQPVERQNYEREIKQQLLVNQLSSLVYSFGTESPEELLLYVQNHPLETGLYFLDTEMGIGQVSGMQLAEQIRQSDPQALIVFFAYQKELSVNAIQRHIEPLDYIIKTSDHKEEYQQIMLDLKIAQQRDKVVPENKTEIFTYKLESRIYKLDIQKKLIILVLRIHHISSD